ncbi:tRNA (adenosine(37)-N6)-threonylcarbamoyltransferase complex transferase subunit TsaD [Halanaerobium congolense]|jgi:N6-L-threonylcarbamoyladenine synthase|uniref:tRNA (adenosine(37)-N6)-threonylcarbamoyltransferase complex transferase subunit TsaD n=2 Tax=Halanaerobium congolense TaxID=54121 RepID=UPI00210E1EA2|nr:tRNA (adenosine(37)-N6)-threonylcarbamoyltransferase complex transferase subunit TsaD [Halanaerobium congolense]
MVITKMGVGKLKFEDKIKNETEDIYILALESSCDETAASVNKNGLEVLSNVVSSQVDLHKKFGGVVPEIASRKHLELLLPVIDQALEEAGIRFEDLDAVASTYGPGLVGGLLVTLTAAKTISFSLNIPLIGVNHIAGHIYANFIENPDIEKPLICLTISGGHTDLLYFENLRGYKILGRTLDDAAGEAFDKISRFLELGYPGGPAVEKAARSGDKTAIDFPRADLGDSYNFSFSGLKTSVMNYVNNEEQRGNEIDKNDLSASFQEAVVDSLASNIIKAVKEYDVKSVVLSGGVAANQRLREVISERIEKYNLDLYYPKLELCTDNAAMIGVAAYYQYLEHDFAPLSISADPALKL